MPTQQPPSQHYLVFSPQDLDWLESRPFSEVAPRWTIQPNQKSSCPLREAEDTPTADWLAGQEFPNRPVFAEPMREPRPQRMPSVVQHCVLKGLLSSSNRLPMKDCAAA
jgi:hypothetical protein